jgi:hypothetical protein
MALGAVTQEDWSEEDGPEERQPGHIGGGGGCGGQAGDRERQEGLARLAAAGDGLRCRHIVKGSGLQRRRVCGSGG